MDRGGEGEGEYGVGRPFTSKTGCLCSLVVVEVESLGIKEVGVEESLLCTRVDPER
jgi:hypothetical protein